MGNTEPFKSYKETTLITRIDVLQIKHESTNKKIIFKLYKNKGIIFVIGQEVNILYDLMTDVD